jgi:hypothetical protein
LRGGGGSASGVIASESVVAKCFLGNDSELRGYSLISVEGM